MMENSGPKDFDILSNLTNELREIEGREGGVIDPARADEVREGLVAAMRGVFKSHYDFAVALDRYHKLYKAKKIATAAMARIAAAYGCSARTLYRLLSNYDNARQLPLVFVDVMREQGLDPVRTANQPLVNELVAARKPADHAEAEASLNAARVKVAKIAPAAQTTPNDVGGKSQDVQIPATAPEPANREEAKVVRRAVRAKVVKIAPAAQTTLSDAEEFATRIVGMFEKQFGSYCGADRDEQIRAILERVVNALGADVHELRTYGRPNCAPNP
jgi:leucyl aminopeptidase (aminopeptidase T)